jgi:nitrous oxidase accessory protein NosD
MKCEEERIHKENRGLFFLRVIHLPTLAPNEQVYNTSGKYFLLYSANNTKSSEH